MPPRRSLRRSLRRSSNEAVRKRLAPHLSRSLRELLEQAAATEREIASCEAKDSRGSCEVNLSYGAPGDASKSRWKDRWKDRVLLVKSGDGWVVDDVEYGGDWEFMHEGTLRGVLTNVIRSGREDTAAARKEREAAPIPSPSS